MKKINQSDESVVREKVASGVKKLADMVSLTLGNHGRSVIIERPGDPLIVDDGRRVAENVKLDDPIENMAARVLYSVTKKTDEKSGDGTTTATVLANAILQSVFKNNLAVGVGAQTNVGEVDALIKKSCAEVVVELNKRAKPVKSEKDLIDVATVVSGDAELGKIIGNMYWQLGKDGHISLEFNLLTEVIETEVVPGYRFSAGYAADWMITDALRRHCVIDDVDVLITRQKITDFKEQIAPIANMVGNNGKSRLVVIAPKFSPSVLKNIYLNATRKAQPFVILAIRAPGRGEEACKDMAVFTGGHYFSEDSELKNATQDDLGYCERVEATEDTVILIGGKGKKVDVDKRIKEVEAEAKNQKLHQFKQDRLERLSALAGGVGVIKIGAPTDEERNWLKYKIEDAKYATKHAIREGIVPGGGLTFKAISEALPEGNILKQALLAPYETLKRHAGGKLVVGKNVFDPVAVERAALEIACSAVSKLIRIGGAIAYKTPSNFEDSLKAVVGGNEEGADGLEDDDSL
jgi:chaperonin GroEL